MMVAFSFETELGFNDGTDVPSKTMLVLSEVKVLFVALVSLMSMLELSEVTFAFMMIVPFEKKVELSMASLDVVSFAESRVSSPDCFNQRQAEYSSHTASFMS